MSEYRVYCDESCHLEHDGQTVMLLGCIWAPNEDITRLSTQIRDIKRRHSARGELKWTKVSRSRLGFFIELVDWFFDQASISFRVVVVQRKQDLNHNIFNQGSHNTFYYKTYFSLISKILSPTNSYQLYFDIKDTNSSKKLDFLREVLCTDKYDLSGSMISRMQHVRSHEVELLQLADFLIGAVSYLHRGLTTSNAKLEVVKRIERHHGNSLLESTALTESKFNIFVWQPRNIG